MTRANPSGGERLRVKREDGSEASHSKSLVAEVEPPRGMISEVNVKGDRGKNSEKTCVLFLHKTF